LVLADFGTALQIGLCESSLSNLKPSDLPSNCGRISFKGRKSTSDMTAPSTSSSNDKNSIKENLSLVGTSDYVAPEILQSGEITFSSDLWSLGIIIY